MRHQRRSTGVFSNLSPPPTHTFRLSTIWQVSALTHKRVCLRSKAHKMLCLPKSSVIAGLWPRTPLAAVISQMCSEGIFTSNYVIPSADWITRIIFNSGGVPMHTPALLTGLRHSTSGSRRRGFNHRHTDSAISDSVLASEMEQDVASPCCLQLQSLNSIVRV